MQRLWDYVEWVKQHPKQTCKWTKLAVKRFERDLKDSEKDSFPYRFDIKKARSFIGFTECLKQYKDKWAGQRIHLEPWQVFVFANVYGWVHKDTGLRRFRKAFVFVARKNGKSTMVSSVLIYDLMKTPGAEGYCAATKRDQSKIVYDSVAQMIKQHEDLREHLRIFRSTHFITNEATGGRIAALSHEADTFDGLNPSTAVIDEVAAMKTYDIIQVLQSGTAARPEPLIFEITSGSDNTTSAGAQEFERSSKILEDVYKDETYFCIMYTLDKGDSWKNEANWIKANPNLGISVNIETLRALCKEAEQNPSLEPEFRIKNLGQFLSPVTAWIQHAKWDACIRNARNLPKLEDLRPQDCVAVGAVDLSQKVDFTTFTVAIYHIPTGNFYMRHWFYVPEEQVQDKCKTDSPLVFKWIEQKFINGTPGPTVNYEVMFSDMEEAIDRYKIDEVLYDPWNAGQLMDRIGPLCNLVEVKQNYQSISPMAKDYEASVLEGKIVDDNPVMSWMISNCDIYRDQNGNIKPVKHGGKDSPLHIDGVITSLMGVGRLRSLIDGGYIDTRDPEEIQRDMERRLAAIEY